jgi:hypothetical protein
VEQRRLDNGVVRRAVVRFLSGGQPETPANTRNVIEKLLVPPVSYASVEWCMRMGVRRSDTWIARLRPRWYRIRADE